MIKQVDKYEISYSDYSNEQVCELRGFTDKEIAGDIVIPEKIDGRTVTSIGWLRGYNNITSLTMPDTVEKCVSIKDCKSLKKITFSKSMQKLSSFGFSDTLEEIVIPEGVKIIGNGAFWYCKNLKKVTLPNSIEEIGANAFQNCPMLTEITLPDNLKKLDSTAFMWGNLKGNEEGDATYIGNKSNPHWVFVSWKNKETVPPVDEMVKVIGPDVYAGNLAVEKVEIPNTVEGISGDCFKNCKNLKTVEVPSSVKVVSSNAFHGSTVETVVLSEGIEVIDSCSFWNVKTLKTITIPSSVKRIENQAFDGCGLESVILNEGLETIGNYVFQNCKNLKEIVIPASVKIIGGSCFLGSGIERAEFKGTNVGGIDSALFKDCVNLTTVVSDTGDKEGEVHLPSSIVNIWNSCFENCKSIRAVDLSKNLKIEKVGESVFRNCFSLTKVGLPPFGQNLNKNVFEGCNLTSELKLPRILDDIDLSAFADAKITAVYYDGTIDDWARINRDTPISKDKFDLYIQGELFDELTIGEEIPVVGKCAFANVNLASLTINQGWESIGEGAFYGVKRLQSISCECEDREEPWPTNAFTLNGKPGAVEVSSIFINGVGANITADLFTGIKGVTMVKLGKRVNSIKKGAFENFNALKEIYLPFLGERIDDSKNNYLGYVFGAENYEENYKRTPSSLKKVQVYNAKEIGAGAFYNVKIEELILPSEVQSIGREAFEGTLDSIKKKYNGGEYIALGGNEYAVLVKVDTDEKSFSTASDTKFVLEYSFKNLPKLKEVTISNTVIQISARAFENCKKVGKVNLLNSTGWHIDNHNLSGVGDAYPQKLSSNAKKVAKTLVKDNDGLVKLDVDRKF